MRCFAVIPAGGASRRFGPPKLLAQWQGRTLLEHAVAALREAAERIVVVTNRDLPELAERALAAGALALPLAAPTADMRATLMVGLDWLERNERPAAADGWFLLPGDVPGVGPSVAVALRSAARGRADKSIFVPTCQGKRGHPALLRWLHVPSIRVLPAGQGVDAYLARRRAETLEVAVESAGILADVDTPKALQRLAPD